MASSSTMENQSPDHDPCADGCCNHELIDPLDILIKARPHMRESAAAQLENPEIIWRIPTPGAVQIAFLVRTDSGYFIQTNGTLMIPNMTSELPDSTNIWNVEECMVVYYMLYPIVKPVTVSQIVSSITGYVHRIGRLWAVPECPLRVGPHMLIGPDINGFSKPFRLLPTYPQCGSLGHFRNLERERRRLLAEMEEARLEESRTQASTDETTDD